MPQSKPKTQQTATSNGNRARLLQELLEAPSSNLHPAEQYARDVVTGTIPACKSIIQSCERYWRDVEEAEKKHLWHDPDSAQFAIDFFPLCTPSKGEFADKPLELMPWQQFILWNLYGWKRQDGLRRYREAYVEIPRKNGKSTMLAGTGLYMTWADGEPGAEVYSAATKKDQAKLIWDEAAKMVKASQSLSRHMQCYQTAIVHAASNSSFKALSSDEEKMSGLNVHCGLIDELHEHPNRYVYDILMTSLGSRRQPLIFSITTAGYDRNSICWVQHNYATKVLTRNVEDEGSDSFFAFIAAIDDPAKWDDEAEWYKCNPSLGYAKKIDDMRSLMSKAKEEPGFLNTFLRMHLNCWTQQDKRYLPMDKYDVCHGVEPDENDDTPELQTIDPMILRQERLRDLKDCPCFAGLDLSTTTDISAFVLVFPPCAELKSFQEIPDPDNPGKKKRVEVVIRKANKKWVIVPWFWIPGDNIEKRCKRDKVSYDVWVREGFIATTPDAVIDYDFIREQIKKLGSEYQITEIAVDPYNATQISTQLVSDGFVVAIFRQGDLSMNAPTKELLRLVLKGELAHLANPVLRWMADNLVVREGPTGLVKPDKEKSIEKIDGIVATIMGIGRATATPQSVDFDYEHAIEAW